MGDVDHAPALLFAAHNRFCLQQEVHLTHLIQSLPNNCSGNLSNVRTPRSMHEIVTMFKRHKCTRG